MPNNDSTLGDRIREVREWLGMRQDEFAEALGFKPRAPTVSDWENGRSTPDEATLTKMADLTGKTYEEWFGGMDIRGGAEDATATRVREAAGEYGARADELTEVTPMLSHLEWLPPLLELVLRDPHLSAAEKQGLMAELNAAGMRYWAVSAEWAAGQRGIAMQKAEVASGERAKANGREADSARTRASVLALEPPSEPAATVAEGADDEHLLKKARGLTGKATRQKRKRGGEDQSRRAGGS